MTVYSKPSVRHAWAETAGVNDLTDPGDTYASSGWPLGSKPPRQYFNWVLNYALTGVRYFCQFGISTWDSTETYSIGSLIIASNGAAYRSVINNNVNQNPVSTPLGISWDIPLVAEAAAGDSSGRQASTSFVSHNYIRQGSGFSALAGQISLPQVPSGAVTQWQGALSISGSQVSSAVARSNTLFLSGSNAYASFSWSGQPGQPLWLWGTNDGQSVFVWNPANFSVANSNTLGGSLPSVGSTGNTIVLRDSSGYIYGQYFNQNSGNNENPSISQVMVTNGIDGFLRKASIAALKSALGSLSLGDFPASLASTGYQKLPSGLIINWGLCTPNGGTVFAAFALAYPHAPLAAVATSTGVPTQCNISALFTTGLDVFNSGGQSWFISVGW